MSTLSEQREAREKAKAEAAKKPKKTTTTKSK